MKKSFASRLFSMVLALMLVLCTALSASAAPVKPEDEIMPMYNGMIEAVGATNISDGYGELPVFLDCNVSNGALKAAVSTNNSSGTIDVSVRKPNGNITSLGAMPSSGGTTNLKFDSYLPSGYYIFYFYPSNFNTLNVQGIIYS